MNQTEKEKLYCEILRNLCYDYHGLMLKPEYSDCVFESEETVICPQCGTKMVNVIVKTDRKSWQNLAGREGILEVCPNCGNTGNFELTRMN